MCLSGCDLVLGLNKYTKGTAAAVR